MNLSFLKIFNGAKLKNRKDFKMNYNCFMITLCGITLLRKQFLQKFIMNHPKNKLRGHISQFRLDQVRKAIKNRKFVPLLFSWSWTQILRNTFEGTTMYLTVGQRKTDNTLTKLLHYQLSH